MELRSIIFILTFYLISISAYAQDCKVNLSVNEIKEVKGVFLIAFFDKEDDFLKKPRKAYRIKVDSKPSQLIVLDDVPRGKLALSIIQDKDEDGKLNQSVFGPPSEPYGFGNDAMGFMSPPDFEESLLDLNKEEAEVSIKLK